MLIGPYQLRNPFILAPMAGITDRPFRSVCKAYGAAMAVSEMVSSNPALKGNKRTLLKADHSDEVEPHWVQILGSNPDWMADAARYNVDRGAHIIDINMGCPAKKVCGTAAGSALLKDEILVGRILEAVVNAVSQPVTLKIRTGWDPQNRNAETIAKIAESSGIQALTVHGRTRACGFKGDAEYDTVRQIKSVVNIPVIANGDITSPNKAKWVLEHTGANAIMVGRAALGSPWVFRNMAHYLDHGQYRAIPDSAEVQSVIHRHVQQIHQFYGSVTGVRIARKHIGWYLQQMSVKQEEIRQIYQAQTPEQQINQISATFMRFQTEQSL